MNSILSATVLIPLIVIVLLIVLLCVGYVKAPPDMAYIISGVKKKSKVVIGKASIRIPFFERLDKLNLRLIPIDVKTSNACRQRITSISMSMRPSTSRSATIRRSCGLRQRTS